MQQTQQNYKKRRAQALLWLAFLAVAGSPAHAGIADRDAPEPLLHDGVRGPCDPRLGRPDFVPGVDVNANPVAHADLAKAGNPVPDEVLVPLRGAERNARQGGIVALNGKTLDPILDPAPACPSSRH